MQIGGESGTLRQRVFVAWKGLLADLTQERAIELVRQEMLQMRVRGEATRKRSQLRHLGG